MKINSDKAIISATTRCKRTKRCEKNIRENVVWGLNLNFA